MTKYLLTFTCWTLQNLIPMHCSAILFAAVAVFAGVASAQQQPTNPRFTYNRVLCVVPLIGSGEPGDPKRPDYTSVPAVTESSSASSHAAGNGIIAFYHEVSDDGKWALAEIVARDRAALLPILNDTRPGVWAVEKGTVPRAQILQVFQQFKKSIDLDRFGVAVR